MLEYCYIEHGPLCAVYRTFFSLHERGIFQHYLRDVRHVIPSCDSLWYFLYNKIQYSRKWSISVFVLIPNMIHNRFSFSYYSNIQHTIKTTLKLINVYRGKKDGNPRAHNRLQSHWKSWVRYRLSWILWCKFSFHKLSFKSLVSAHWRCLRS